MSVFSYTASTELSPGTAQDEAVTRIFRLLSRPLSYRSVRKQNTSLSGAVESILRRSEKHYNCLSENIEPGSLLEKQVLEFFASVQNGEQFTFDRHGTVQQPDNPVTCIMVSATLSERESGKRYLQYGFVIREV